MTDLATSLTVDDPSPVAAPDMPYVATITVRGASPILFHRWNDDAVETKAAAAKGSKAKKTDDIESYVWRNHEGVVCLPGTYLHGSLVDPRNGAAKYRQDPRSPRKSALDLFRAGVIPLTDMAPITTVTGDTARTWDYLDRRRATVQRSAITRVRPAFLTGWTATVQLMVQTPEYITPDALLDALGVAGRLVGVGDYRPVFGRFNVVAFMTGLDT